MENQHPIPQNPERAISRMGHVSAAARGVLLNPPGLASGVRTPSVEITRDVAMKHFLSEMIAFIGDDPTREGVLDTPKRVLKSWAHLFSGYSVNPREVLGTQFNEAGSEGIVLCRGIEMYSTCEHHLLPFFGTATVGYLPKNGRIVGLSKLARLVEAFSRRLQNQERITRQVADALQDALDPVAVGVVIEAEHFCMRARGVEKQGASMVTSCFTGTLKTDGAARAEFLRMAGR